MKKGTVLFGVVILFVGYLLFTEPSTLASFVKDAAAAVWDLTVQFFDALTAFLKSL